jgi:plasmid stability protein
MKSMTVHKMDDLLIEAIKSRAEEKGESVNAMMKELLAKAVGIESSPGSDTRQAGYRRFLGYWTEGQAADFERATVDFEALDESDWSQ